MKQNFAAGNINRQFIIKRSQKYPPKMKKWVKMAKSNKIFVPLFSRYSNFFVTFGIVRYFVTWKVTSYSNAITCNALL